MERVGKTSRYDARHANLWRYLWVIERCGGERYCEVPPYLDYVDISNTIFRRAI